VLHTVDLVVRPEFTLHSVTCNNDDRSWSPPEVRPTHGIMLVRQGRFRLAADGRVTDLDPAVAYLAAAGVEIQFAHPAGGDRCTWITLPAQGWQRLMGDQPAGTAIYVDAEVELIHRRVRAAADAGDVDYALTEQLIRLLSRAMPDPVRRAERRSAAVCAADAALVTAAREAIATDHISAGRLISLAAYLGASPSRLSRAFTRQLGVSLTGYRIRVRVGRALSQLADGHTALGSLAVDLGFADQAHLCRTIRAQVGHTPTAVRKLLEPGHRQRQRQRQQAFPRFPG
jgi:AraC-like DNA-binding protein